MSGDEKLGGWLEGLGNVASSPRPAMSRLNTIWMHIQGCRAFSGFSGAVKLTAEALQWSCLHHHHLWTFTEDIFGLVLVPVVGISSLKIPNAVITIAIRLRYDYDVSRAPASSSAHAKMNVNFSSQSYRNRIAVESQLWYRLKAFFIRSTAQRNFAYTFLLVFPTDLPSQIFKLISN